MAGGRSLGPARDLDLPGAAYLLAAALLALAALVGWRSAEAAKPAIVPAQ